MLDEVNPGRVHRLRVCRGYTQAELAERMGLATASLSRVLSGHQQADDSQERTLARILDCDIELLRKPVSDSLYTRPWLRAYADAPKKVVEQFVADSLLAVETIEALRLRRIPERLPSFGGDPENPEEIDEFSQAVRDAAEIVSQHVPNVTRAAERLGCIVLPMRHELGRHLGMSLFVNGIPVIRAARPSSSVPGDRQRFTIAHELGHLTMHQSIPPPDTAQDARLIELQAHRFAGAFLLPADQFLQDVDNTGRGRVTLSTLAKLKSKWGVSIKAMVVRLQHLRRIDNNHARSLYKQISARGWNKNESVQVANEGALWLSQALAKIDLQPPFEQQGGRVGLGPSYFESWLDWSATDLDADIIFLDGRR